jgi:hypothetical protein
MTRPKRAPHPATVERPRHPPHAATVVQAKRPFGHEVKNAGRPRDAFAIQRATAVDFRKQDSVPVIQGEIVVTSATGARPVLATSGLGPCVGLVIRGPTMTALAHVDGAPMSHALRQVVEQMRAVDGAALEAHVYASSIGLEGHLVRLRTMLRQLDVPLAGVTVHDSAHAIDPPALNMAVDARTGEVFLDVRAGEVGPRGAPYSTALSAAAVRRIRPMGAPSMIVSAVDAHGVVTWAGDAFDAALLDRVDRTTLDPKLVADFDAESRSIGAPGYGKRTISGESAIMTEAVRVMLERAAKYDGPVTILGADDGAPDEH